MRTAIISGVALFSVACTSMDSAAIQAAERQEPRSDQTLTPVSAAPAPTPPATAAPVAAPEPRPVAIERALAQIKQLSTAQRTEEALALIDQLLQRYPDNPDLRLMQGVLLNQLGQTQQAEYVFRRLSEQHPELPEPLNNLAVIYANRGDMNRAISTLQQAFETHPSYARIQSNLRSLYTTLASQAYNRALNLGGQAPTPNLASLDRIAENQSHSASAPARLMTVAHQAQPLSREEVAEVQVELVRAAQARALQARAGRHTAADAPAAAATTDSAPSPSPSAASPGRAAAPVQLATAEAAPEAAPADPAEPADQAAPNAAPAEAAESAAATASQASPSPSDREAERRAAVEQSLRGWARAWSAQDVAGYLAYYVDDYRPNSRTSHQAWVKQRNQRLKRPKFIEVTLDQVEIRLLDERRAETVFEQHYRADRYQDRVTKTLRWQRVGDRWLITQEQSD